MISLNNEPCPICDETRSEPVQETTYPEHRYPGSFVLRRCAGCGLLFNSPRLGPAELSELYGKNYYFFNRRDDKEMARIVGMYRRTIGMLDESSLLPKESIDIGTGHGYFPALLKALGWKADGVEISDGAAELGRQKFGLDVFTGTAETYAASSSAKAYPFVTAIDVIEHVPAPSAFIAALALITAPGGRLIVDTPNAGAENIGPLRELWKGFNPFHIFLFTADNLSTLLRKHGFEVERTFSYNNDPVDATSLRLAQRAQRLARATLGRTGLLGPMVGAYFKLKGLPPQPADVTPLLNNAIDQAKREPSWSTSPDAKAPLARTGAGDNIVVIAKRMS